MNLEDIAKKAGVSRSTVSRVINKEPYVSEKTRQRVLAVIEQEGFSPNPAARALVTQRTFIIGVVIPGNIDVFFTDNSYYPMLLQGIAVAAHERDFALLLWLGQSHDDRDHFTRKVLGNRQMDGLVIASLQSDHPLIVSLPDFKVPLVTVDRPEMFYEQISYVTVDNVRAAIEAVSHLISLGRRRIAHITGHLTITDGQDRLLGYRRALEQAGIPFDPLLVHEGNFSYEQGYEGMKRLLASQPDALFAAGDTIAMGALQALREAGLRVPEDVAIVGFDDLDEAFESKPPLTTVRQPVQQKGAQAAHLLIDLIEGKRVGPHHVLLPTELIVRQSTISAHPPFQTQYKGGEVQQQV
ncbi:MAG: LacI family transcriptional regulator [Anaerolineae bacterium]|nr:LacI family transcriptional regulator [Anaerolineae bacterium]